MRGLPFFKWSEREGLHGRVGDSRNPVSKVIDTSQKKCSGAHAGVRCIVPGQRCQGLQQPVGGHGLEQHLQP